MFTVFRLFLKCFGFQQLSVNKCTVIQLFEHCLKLNLLSMLRRILFTFLVIIFISAGIFGYLYYQKLKVPTAAAINAIPTNATLIIQIKKANQVWKSINENNIIWKDLVATPYFAQINDYASWLDNVVNENGSLGDAVENSSLFISYHGVDSVNSGFLFCLSVPADVEEKYLDEIVKTSAGPANYFSQRVVNGAVVYETKNKNNNSVFSYAIKKGVFVASYNTAVLDQALEQLNNSSTLLNQVDFEKVYKTINADSEINLLFNYQNTFVTLNTLLSDSTKQRFNHLNKIAEWSALDVKSKANSINLNGLTSCNPKENNFLSLFKDQAPKKFGSHKIMPVNTASFLLYNFSNFRAFYNGYTDYLKRRNITNRTSTGYDANNALQTVLGNEVASFLTEPGGDVENENAYIIVKPFALNSAAASLNQISVKVKASNNESNDSEENIKTDNEDSNEKSDKKKKKEKDEDEKDNESKEEVANDSSVNSEPIIKEIEIRKLSLKGSWQAILGDDFGLVTENYFAIIEEYVVFGNSAKAINNIINYYQNQKTLAASENYKSFSENLSDNASVYIYTNIPRSEELYNSRLSDNTLKLLEPYRGLMQKFEGIGIQYSANKELFYTNVFVKHNPVYKKETNSLWEVSLDAPVAIKPKVVNNHINQTKEIIVQDINGTLYLINNKGEIVWRKKLEETILSDITQIDRFKNNKLQYVFNTRNYIYMLDRNGDFCQGFPVKLKYPATNTLSVFDYEKNRDYRLMIACDNKRVYNYDADGENVMGWEFTLMKNAIIHPVQHFIINGKDYIITIDKSGEIRLVDRKGKSILEFNQKIPVAKNSDFYIDKGKELNSSFIVASDSLGRVMKFKFTDRLDIIELKGAGKNHYFDYKDIDDDDKRDYIFADGNELNVFDQDQNTILTFKTKTEISAKPLFFLFPNGSSKIGLVSRGSNLIYLVNNKAQAEKGFPKYGSTSFSISDINKDRVFNVVVGGADKSIYTYSLED